MSFKVDFVIIGAMKSGTTDLAMRLAMHRGVCFCKQKEPHFFSTNDDWADRLDEYHRMYSPQPGQICGEASTSYSYLGEYPQVVQRLHDYNPNFKLIYIVRDPVERIKSHYAHRLMRGIAERDASTELRIRKQEYLNRSQYGRTLQQYVRTFPRRQMLVLTFEEYIRDEQSATARVCEFLGLPGEDTAQVTAKNKSTGSNRSRLSPVYYIDRVLAYSPPPLRRVLSRYMSVKLTRKPEFPKHLEQDLWNDLERDIAQFEQLTGLDISAWKRERTTAGERDPTP